MRGRWLMAAVFFSGMTTLAIELTASRLLGNVFGTTNIVWANIIGLILVYLTAGYFLGGRWADRSPYAATFYRIQLWGAFTAGLVPVVAAPVLRRAALAVESFDAAVMAGSFLSVLILFVAPITLLGCVSPFAIRLAISDTTEAGRISGRIYALSTLGSIVGTFLPVLVTVPIFGTARTFLIFSFSLQAVALIGLALDAGWKKAAQYLWMPIGLLILAFLILRAPIKLSDTAIFEAESSYNYIQVQEIDGVRYLMLNEGQAVHSVYDPDLGPTYGYGTWDHFLVAPFFNPAPLELDQVESLGLVGLAAGTISKQYSDIFGPLEIDGWEIDPKIVNVAREYFDMNEPNLNVIVADGRWGLEQSSKRYDVIGIDAYRPPYIPWQLTTREFFQIAYDHLDSDGVLVINVGRTPQDRRLIEALSATIGAVFPSVHVADVPGTFNTMVYASVQTTNPGNLLDHYLHFQTSGAPAPLIGVMERTIANLQPTPEGGPVFTDDRAPVEQLVNSIVIQFVLGGMEGLR